MTQKQVIPVYIHYDDSEFTPRQREYIYGLLKKQHRQSTIFVLDRVNKRVTNTICKIAEGIAVPDSTRRTLFELASKIYSDTGLPADYK